MARVLINLSAKATRGEIIEIKTLIAHAMETGYGLGPTGAANPRDIIKRFVCTYNGEVVFRAELFPAIAANPFIAFDGRDGERRDRLQLDRRPRPDTDRGQPNHRRMRVLVLAVVAATVVAAAAAEDRTRGPALGL